VEVGDNTKLSLKEYRSLIYKIVEESEGAITGEKSQLAMKKETVSPSDPNKATEYKNRLKGLTRSASKTK